MAIKLKSNIAYQPIVESVSRKFVPRKEVCSAATTAGPVKTEGQGWMGGAVVKSGRSGLGACTRNVVIIRANARTTQPSSAELGARELFTTVQAAVKPMLRNLMAITTIQMMFKQGGKDRSKTVKGVSPYGYTMRGFVFAVLYAAKKNDPDYDLTTWPSTWDDGSTPQNV
jgi:hypothetical protein